MTRMMTTKDLQSLLQVDRSTIYRMAESGRLPGIKIGRQWRFPADDIDRWLKERNLGPAPDTPQLGGTGLTSLLPADYVSTLGDLVGEMLGVMVVVTDMNGNPLAEPSNQCGLFEAVNQYPGAVQRCVAAWRDLATDLDLAPRFAPSHLGLLCARSYVRVGPELRGIILVGGIAPADWPPSPGRLEAMAAEFGADPGILTDHIDEVFHLDEAGRQKVLALVPRLARFLSEVANERTRLLGKLGAIAALAAATET